MYTCETSKLFYRIKANNVELLVFWDTRQDPAKLVL